MGARRLPIGRNHRTGSSFIDQINSTTQPANVQPSRRLRTNMAALFRFLRPMIEGRKYTNSEAAQMNATKMPVCSEASIRPT